MGKSLAMSATFWRDSTAASASSRCERRRDGKPGWNVSERQAERRERNLPGAPWRIADLRADIDTDGRIRVRGRGLLLANGNNIGQNANVSVFATLDL